MSNPCSPCSLSHLHNNKVSCSFEGTVSGGAGAGAGGRGSMHLIRDPRSFTDQSQAAFRNHRAQQAALCLLHFLHLLHSLATSSRPSRFTQKCELQLKCDAQEASSMQLRCREWVLAGQKQAKSPCVVCVIWQRSHFLNKKACLIDRSLNAI